MCGRPLNFSIYQQARKAHCLRRFQTTHSIRKQIFVVSTIYSFRPGKMLTHHTFVADMQTQACPPSPLPPAPPPRALICGVLLVFCVAFTNSTGNLTYSVDIISGNDSRTTWPTHPRGCRAAGVPRRRVPAPSPCTLGSDHNARLV